MTRNLTTPTTNPAATEQHSARRYEMTTWDLSELLPEPTEEVITRRLQELEDEVQRFESRRPELQLTIEREDFLSIVVQYEALMDSLSILSGYSSLWFSSDTQAAPAIAFKNRVSQFITDLQNRFLFFELWWQGLEAEDAQRLQPSAEENGDLHHYLQELRNFRPYILDETSEQIINIKNANGIEAINTIYSMLTNRLEFHPQIQGERQTLTEGEIRSRFYSADPDERQVVYEELFSVYEKEAPVLAQIYANRVRDWHSEYVELRGMKSPIAVRNLSNNIPDAAIETLLEVVHSNAPIFQDYFRLKGKWLGFEPLRRYDLYAPLASSDQVIPYSDAIDNVLSTFRNFDERFAQLAERVLAQNHIDSEIRKGKRGGAFCATVTPRYTPWVLVNYAGKVRDVATVAHELGHAMHSMLAEHHSVLTQHPSLPLAETASVFAEMLMTDRLLADEKDPMARRELLAAAVDDVYATVMRQTYFVRFEQAAHRAVMANKSADDLFDLYLDNLREQFGDSMDITDEFRLEWVGIPHLFRTPFYCYAYSFGQLLVLALYRRYQQQGEAFKPGYFRLLSYGGSASPEVILRELDIEITDASFWQGGFEVVRDMIDELKSIEVS